MIYATFAALAIFMGSGSNIPSGSDLRVYVMFATLSLTAGLGSSSDLMVYYAIFGTLWLTTSLGIEL